MKKKKILMIVTMPFYTEKGSSLRVFSIVSTLAKEYEIDMVIYSSGKEVTIPNVNIYRTPNFFKPNVGVNKVSFSKIILDFFVLLKCLLLILRNKYDVYHAEDFEAAFIVRILLIANKKPKFVYDLHNRILDNLTLKKNLSAVTRWVVLKVELFVVRRVDVVLLNWDKYSTSPLFSDKNKILLYDQVDIESVEEISLPVKGPYLVYVGNFEKYQGILDFLKVYKDCSVNYSLVLIGNSSKEVQEFIKENNLAERVILTGSRSVPQVNYLISNSMAGILPRIEGSSMKVIHYLALGKPVIANNTSSNREILTHGVNSYLYSSAAELKEILSTKISGDHLLKFSLAVHRTKAFIYQRQDTVLLLGKYI